MDRLGSADSRVLIFDRRFLGLAMMEFWERFAVAAVKSLLVLILADHIFGGELAHALGAPALRGVLEHCFGPLAASGLASQVYGYAFALLYLAVPLGGLAGDLLIGRPGAVYLGGAIMLVGLMLMLQIVSFLPGLVLCMAGAGMLKGNLSAQLGGLFATEEERQRGYSAYLGFLNAGVICGPLVCGALAAWAGWSYAIAAAALALLVGLGGYGWAMPRAGQAVAARETPAAAPRQAARPTTALLATAILSIYCCYAAYDQVSDIFLLWARAHVQLRIGDWEMPVSWFASLDGLFTLLLILGSQWLFPRLARRGVALSAQRNILIGCLFCVAGYLLLAMTSGAGAASVPIGWTLLYVLLIDIAVVLIWPSGLSLISAVAPPRLVGFWMGLFYLHGFFAGLWAGISGSYYGRMPDSDFWLLHVAMAGVGAVLAITATALERRSPRRLQAITTSA